MKYPTWIMLTSNWVVTEEQQDGTPDATIVRERGRWFLKWRTSQNWDGASYSSLKEAKAAFDKALVKW